MNDIIKAMKERRSIRKFKPDMPSAADIDQIIEAGLYAPSGMGKQAAVILAITDKTVRDRLSDANRRIGGWQEGFDPFYGAPVILVVLADKECRTSIYDGALVMQNLMLAAHSLGLGSIWIHRAKEEFEQEEWKSFLRSHGIDGDFEGVGHCAIGFADCEQPQPTPRKDGRVFRV